MLVLNVRDNGRTRERALIRDTDVRFANLLNWHIVHDSTAPETEQYYKPHRAPIIHSCTVGTFLRYVPPSVPITIGDYNLQGTHCLTRSARISSSQITLPGAGHAFEI